MGNLFFGDDDGDEFGADMGYDGYGNGTKNGGMQQNIMGDDQV